MYVCLQSKLIMYIIIMMYNIMNGKFQQVALLLEEPVQMKLLYNLVTLIMEMVA